MIKIITDKKPENKVFDLDSNMYIGLKHSSPISIARDMCEFLISTNGVAYLKMEREPKNIKVFFEVLKFLHNEIKKYELEETKGVEKLTVLFDLPVNKKAKVTEENYFLPHTKDKGYNLIKFRLALKNTSRINETDKYNFVEVPKCNNVRISADTKEHNKNCGQIASFVLRSIIKDGNDISMSFISSSFNNSLEVKAYGSLVILERMRKEDLGMICGSFEKIPDNYRGKRIKLFGEVCDADETQLSPTKSLTKIKLWCATKNGVIIGER